MKGTVVEVDLFGVGEPAPKAVLVGLSDVELLTIFCLALRVGVVAVVVRRVLGPLQIESAVPKDAAACLRVSSGAERHRSRGSRGGGERAS